MEQKLCHFILASKYATSFQTRIYSIYVDIYAVCPYRTLANVGMAPVSQTHAANHNVCNMKILALNVKIMKFLTFLRTIKNKDFQNNLKFSNNI